MAADPLLLGVLGILALCFVAMTVLLWQVRRKLDSRQLNGQKTDDGSHEGIDTAQLEAALSRTFREFDVERMMADLERHAAALREFHGDIETMLAQPRERGEFGEVQLDVILSDHLPPELYGIREQVVDGKTPDAHIRTTDGVVPIDSKFPLENYLTAAEAETEGERRRAQARFATDVEGHLEKIDRDYVRPEAGTTSFAFAFIPSESVYYHLVTEERELLREFTTRGVQVVSPLTLGHKLELIKADVRTQQLGEEAEAVRKDLQRLGEAFASLEDDWSTLRRHINNAEGKAADVDRRYQALRAEFERVEAPEASSPGAGSPDVGVAGGGRDPDADELSDGGENTRRRAPSKDEEDETSSDR